MHIKSIIQKIGLPSTRARVLGIIVMPVVGLANANVADLDRFTLQLGAKEYWDSNFSRNADEDSEHYTHSTIALALNERMSKQQFSVGVIGNYYQYAQRDDLNVNFYEGKANWRSNWSPRLKTAIDWTRDAYAVDRLEFVDKDVVARNNLTGQVTLDVGKNIGITLGARDIGQTHSNELRESLDYDEEEGFVAVTYSTANESSLSVRLREGAREYVHPEPDALQVLDFDFRQVELEGLWAMTRKTQVGFTLGRFKREGDVNAGTGTQALIDFDWAMSEKVKLSLRYSQSEPAIGETSDSPSEVRSSRATLDWEPSSKWLFSMAAGYSKQAYLQRLDEPARDEKITTISPFSLTYRFSDKIRINLDSHWVDRQSPLLYRDYDYTQANVGVALVF